VGAREAVIGRNVKKYTVGVIRSLTLFAALAFSAPALALAQHVPPPRIAPVVIHPAPAVHVAPIVVHPAPIVVHPAPVVVQFAPVAIHSAPIVIRPVPVVPPATIRVAPVTPHVTAPQAIPGRYPWRQWWIWNRAMLFQFAPPCWGSSWGTWGMLASPTLGATVSEEPFQVYDAYEYGPWGAAATSPCAPPAFTGI